MLKAGLKSISIVVILLLSGQEVYSVEGTIVGDIKAVVLNNSILIGDSSFEIKDVVSVPISDQRYGSSFGEDISYNIRSEPHSFLSIHYNLIDYNSILKKDKDSIKTIDEVDHNYVAKSLTFDKNGDAKLRVNPIFFLKKDSDLSNRKVVYYITLLY